MNATRFSYYLIISILISVFACRSGNEQEPDKSPADSEQTELSAVSEQPDETETANEPFDSSVDKPGQASDEDLSITNSRSNAITRAVNKVSPAVVSITVTEVVGGRRLRLDEFYGFFLPPLEREVNSMGSGFIISEDGLVVTNEHVASKSARKVMVSLPDGSEYEAEILGADELADISLLKIKADRMFPYVEFGDSDDVMVGEWSIGIGNPFGLFEAAQPSVTVGVVSATKRDFRPDPNEPRVYMDMIQTDAAINRGNSGGPLVNSNGEVIGINTFIYTGGTSYGFVGLGFAIPSNRAQKIISQLSRSGEVKLSYHPGFETTPMTYRIAAMNNLPAIMGLLVTSVNKDGPAFEAGIMPGDIILKIGDERIQSEKHAQALMREYEEGDTMRLELLRRGQRYEAQMKLRKKASARDGG